MSPNATIVIAPSQDMIGYWHLASSEMPLVPLTDYRYAAAMSAGQHAQQLELALRRHPANLARAIARHNRQAARSC